ncbi:MAG: SDR family NAD(P)-dependent oxidoreductase [Kiritimatiellae bacterium]|nr:SDR family NAD(P)-dependent oxidoreductase [Kiritimatiellia bacterium]
MENKKTVLITGGAKRVGAVIAEQLASKGWNVIIHCNRSIDDAERLSQKLKEQYSIESFAINGDFSDPVQADKVFERAVGKAGKVDALINNASIFSVSPSVEASPEDYKHFLQINTLAPIRMTELFAAHLREQKAQGVVINILDQRIINPLAEETPYLISKRELAAFTLRAAHDLAPDIRVNAVAPGAVLRAKTEEEKEMAGEFLLNHRPTPQGVAQAVLYLLTADSVTGQTIFIDSGQHLV